MRGDMPGPPAGKAWVWITRDAMSSEAWRALSINARRLLDFLMLENMAHAGRHNGFLLAPRDQLIAFGIGVRYVTKAMAEVEASGLAARKQGKGRRPSTYSLTWLPVAGVDFSAPEKAAKSSVAVSQGIRPRVSQGIRLRRSSIPKDTATGRFKGIPRDTPYKKLLTGSSNNTGLSGNGALPGPGAEALTQPRRPPPPEIAPATSGRPRARQSRRRVPSHELETDK